MEDTPNASAQQKGLPAADVKAWHENEYARPPPVHGFLCAGPGAFFGPCHTLCRHSSRAQCTDRSAPRTGVSAGARSAPAGLDAADFRAPPGGEETAQERMHRHHRLLKACSWRIEKDQRGSWTLCPPRNHRRLVAFISWMVLGVGANCDIQVRSAACGGSEAGSVCEISSSRAHPPHPKRAHAETQRVGRDQFAPCDPGPPCTDSLHPEVPVQGREGVQRLPAIL